MGTLVFVETLKRLLYTALRVQ